MSIFMIVMCMFQVSGGAGEDNYWHTESNCRRQSQGHWEQRDESRCWEGEEVNRRVLGRYQAAMWLYHQEPGSTQGQSCRWNKITWKGYWINQRNSSLQKPGLSLATEHARMCHNAPPRAENAFLWLRFGEGWQATACIEDLAIWHGLAVECLASPPLAIAGCWLVPRTPRTYNSCLGSRYGGAEHLYPLVPIWSICACTCITLTFLLWRDGSSRMTPKTQHRNSKKDRRRQLITKTHQAATTLPKKVQISWHRIDL